MQNPPKPSGGQRICLITAGHLSTCPRMLKAADALWDAGYNVRVVTGDYISWARPSDRRIHSTRQWQWQPIPFLRDGAAALYFRSGLRQRGARAVARIWGASHVPVGLAARASLRIFPELVRAALSHPADLYYAGGGALAVAAEAGRRSGKPFALDAEDFHSGEQEGPGAEFGNALARRIENRILSQAAFLTAASPAIGAAYSETYDVQPITIHNTFPLPQVEPEFTAGGNPLQLYWFSQTIGPMRGLEEVVSAVARARISAALHLRGGTLPDYAESLRRLAIETGARLQIFEHKLAAPDRMVELCCAYDVGLAVEQPHTLRLQLALSNKLLTYILGGLAVLATDTAGQHVMAGELGEGAVFYAPGDIDGLAAGLRRWDQDRDALVRAKRACWAAAKRRWHWEHESERGALLGAVAAALAA